MNALMRLVGMMVLVALLQACSYNTKQIEIGSMQGPITEVVPVGTKVLEVPDDPVFGAGPVEDKQIEASRYQEVLAKMPGVFINEMLAYTYAWHHGAAFNKRTGESYRVQSIYAGTKGGFAGIPCGRYLEVLVEGLDSVDPDVFVVIGNTRGDQWFDLRGNPVSFTQEEYLSGKWKNVANIGTSLNDVFAAYQNNDLVEAKEQIRQWAAIGRYRITDASDASKVWYIVTPYSAPYGGTDIIKELATINSRYSVQDKALAAMDGVVVSTSPEITALSIALAAIKIPFIKEYRANEQDMATMAERLDAETKAFNGCVKDITYVPVPVPASVDKKSN